MGTKTYNNYEDLLTFTRASEGHALRPVSYGDEIINNGDFELGDNGDWGVSTNWTISGGVATLVGGDGVYGNSGLYQVIDLDVGKIYKVSLDVSGLTGTFRIYHASYSTGTNIDSTGTLVFNIVGESGGTRLNILGNNGSTVTLDNISVKEVLFDQPDGTLTLFPHPENVPRVEYDADGNRLGLLVEEARTNLLTYSEDFTVQSGRWANGQKGDTSLTSGLTESPSMSDSVWKLFATSGTGTQIIQEDATVSGATNVVGSVYLKKAEYKYGGIRLLDSSPSTGYSVFIDLDDGSVFDTSTRGTPTTSDYRVQDAGNGWWRLSVITSSDGGSVNFTVGISDGTSINSFDCVSFAGDGTSGIYIWGAQVEEGSFPTSYMKNEGTSSGKDRAADVAKIPVADFGYNYTNTVGTFLVDWNTFDDGAGRVFVATSSASASGNRAIDINFNVGTSRVDVYSNHTVGHLYDLGTLSSVGNKVAAAMKENDSAAVLNGGTVDTDTATGTPITATHFHFGNYNSNYLNGHIKSIKYYPRRLTNAQLQDLTT